MDTMNQGKEEKLPIYSLDFTYFSSKEKIKAFILWSIHHKKYPKMKKVFYEQVQDDLNEPISKQAYKEALEYLGGAELIINEVIIADKVSSNLLERFRICRE